MVDCWGEDDDEEQSWDAPARLVVRLRNALDALAADGGAANGKRRARAVERRTQHLRTESERERRREKYVRPHVLARRADTIRALEKRGIAWKEGKIPTLIEARLTSDQLREIPPRNKASAYVAATIGDDLRVAREHAGLTRAEFAKRIGMRAELVRGVETGRAKLPGGSGSAVRWLRACGLPANWNRMTWEQERRASRVGSHQPTASSR
jgi:DNA-binding transcriptional regulator YiaG